MIQPINANRPLWSVVIAFVFASYMIWASEIQSVYSQTNHQSFAALSSVIEDPNDIYWDDRFNTLGTDGTVLALAFDGEELYVGGSFTTVGSVAANNIAKWDGSNWTAIGSASENGVNGTVLAIRIIGADVYVGGSFSMAGTVSANNIAKWNGNAWSALGSGVSDGDVRAIAAVGSEVYVGGVFTTTGGVAANNIAKWNGSSWTALGSGLSGPAYALAVKDNLLYVGGSFTSAGGQSANNIVVWNSSSESWSALGGGVTLGDVNSVLVNGTEVFVAGTFTTAGGQSAKKIARWNGSVWSALGDGITGGDVNALTMINNDLYVAGSFTTAGSISAANIAKWDGSDWSALGSGISGGIVFAIAANASNLYAGGSFTSAGGKLSNHFAHWTALDGSVPVELVAFTAKVSGHEVELNWATATETNNFGFEVERLLVKSTASGNWEKIAFVKGHGTTTEPRFYQFKDDVSGLNGHDAAQYRLRQIDLDGAFAYSNIVEVALSTTPETFSLSQNYPNPFNPETTIEFTIPAPGRTTLTVYNLLGQKVATLIDDDLDAGIQHRVKFNGGTLSSGLYVYVLKSGDSGLTAKRTMMLIK